MTKALRATSVLFLAVGCAACAMRTITSDPPDARIFAGPSPDQLYRSVATTPAMSPRVFQWPRYCFQVRKPGFRDSDIQCASETFFTQNIHFVLEPISTARLAPRPVFRPARGKERSRRARAPSGGADSARQEAPAPPAQPPSPAPAAEAAGPESELFTSAAAAVASERGKTAFQAAADALATLGSIAGLDMNYGDYLRHLSAARARLDELAAMGGEVPEPAVRALRSAVETYEEALTVWNYRRGLPKELRSGTLPVPYAASDERIARWVERCPVAKAAAPEGSPAPQAWIPVRVLECLWAEAHRLVREAETAMAAGGA